MKIVFVGSGPGLSADSPARSSSETIWCSRRRRVRPRALVDWELERRLQGRSCYPLPSPKPQPLHPACRALITTTTDAVKPWFEWVFREYGLPETLTDNGPRPVAAGA